MAAETTNKTCPVCDQPVWDSARVCWCGHEFRPATGDAPIKTGSASPPIPDLAAADRPASPSASADGGADQLTLATALGGFLIALSAFLPWAGNSGAVVVGGNSLITFGGNAWFEGLALVICGPLIAVETYRRVHGRAAKGTTPLQACLGAAAFLSICAARPSLRTIDLFAGGSVVAPFGAALYVGVAGVLLALGSVLQLQRMGALGPDLLTRCPQCTRKTRTDADACKHCGARLLTPSTGAAPSQDITTMA